MVQLAAVLVRPLILARGHGGTHASDEPRDACPCVNEGMGYTKEGGSDFAATPRVAIETDGPGG
jgi:hypothetical protein